VEGEQDVAFFWGRRAATEKEAQEG